MGQPRGLVVMFPRSKFCRLKLTINLIDFKKCKLVSWPRHKHRQSTGGDAANCCVCSWIAVSYVDLDMSCSGKAKCPDIAVLQGLRPFQVFQHDIPFHSRHCVTLGRTYEKQVNEAQRFPFPSMTRSSCIYLSL